jgi:hypothetical protein
MYLLKELNWEKVRKIVGFWSFFGYTKRKFIDILGDAYSRLHKEYLVIEEERHSFVIQLGEARNNIKYLEKELNASNVLLRKFVRESAAFCYKEEVTDEEIDRFICGKKGC